VGHVGAAAGAARLGVGAVLVIVGVEVAEVDNVGDARGEGLDGHIPVDVGVAGGEGDDMSDLEDAVLADGGDTQLGSGLVGVVLEGALEAVGVTEAGAAEVGVFFWSRAGSSQ